MEEGGDEDGVEEGEAVSRDGEAEPPDGEAGALAAVLGRGLTGGGAVLCPGDPLRVSATAVAVPALMAMAAASALRSQGARRDRGAGRMLVGGRHSGEPRGPPFRLGDIRLAWRVGAFRLRR